MCDIPDILGIGWIELSDYEEKFGRWFQKVHVKNTLQKSIVLKI